MTPSSRTGCCWYPSAVRSQWSPVAKRWLAVLHHIREEDEIDIGPVLFPEHARVRPDHLLIPP